MTLKYESEILFDLMKRDGDDAPSDVLPYESELKEKYLNQVEGAYPKLQDYRPEWLNYNLYKHLPADFPVESVSNVTEASFQNVVPYAFGKAILKGQTLVNLATHSKRKILNVQNLSESDGKLTWNTTASWGKVGFTIQGKTNTTYCIRYSDKHETLDFYIRLVDDINGTAHAITVLNSNCRKFTTDETGIFTLTLEQSSATTDSWIKNFIILEYVEGMENCDIPYFEGMQSVKMPVLTTSNEDGTKTNILTVNEDVMLRGIGDVQDTLNCLTGEVTERVGEIVLNGSENWVRRITEDNNDGFEDTLCFYYRTTNMSEEYGLRPQVLCDRFNYLDVGYSKTGESISSYKDGTYGNRDIFIRIKRERLETEDLDGFKKWLKTNILTIQYPIEKVIKTVELTYINEQGETIDFMPLEGAMYVETSSDTLPPLLDMEVPVEAVNQNLASFIEG